MTSHRRIAALYVNGEIVTGENHGIAFGKLTVEQQISAELVSGFFDPDSQYFLTDSQSFWMKKILLVRHAHVENQHITDIGRQQASMVASFLQSNVHGCEFFSSPVDRCQETLQEICKVLSCGYSTSDSFEEQRADESERDFLHRLHNGIGSLPEFSVVCTHCPCIVDLLTLALQSVDLSSMDIPHCSVSYIDKGEIKLAGEVVSKGKCTTHESILRN